MANSYKTFFNFENILKSWDLSQAICISKGIGPICGFNNFKKSGDVVTIGYSASTKEDNRAIINYINSLVKSHNVAINKNVKAINVCITSDGYLHATNQDITVPLANSNNTGSDQEYDIVIFAKHRPDTEAKPDTLTFEAYYLNHDNINITSNDVQSKTSFYNLYQISKDPAKWGGWENENTYHDLYDTSVFSYEGLSGLVFENILGREKPSDDIYSTIIGIYGRRSVDGVMVDYSLIPYNHKWPNNIPYTASIHKYVMDCLTKYDGLFGNLTEDNEEGQNVTDYIDEQISSLKKYVQDELKNALVPSGAIMLWESLEIPDGWEIYNKGAGRVIIGYKEGGLTIKDNIYFNVPGQTGGFNSTYEFTIDKSELPLHKHMLGVQDTAMSGESGPADNPMLTTGDCGSSVNVWSGKTLAAYVNLQKHYDKDNRQWGYTTNQINNEDQAEAQTSQKSIVILPPHITLVLIRKK